MQSPASSSQSLKQNSQSALLQTFSRRFDHVSAKLCAIICLGTLVTCLGTLAFLVIPNISEASALEQRLEAQRAELAVLKEEGRKLHEQVSAMDDPYNIYRVARDVWGFKPDPKATERPGKGTTKKAPKKG